MFLLAANCKAIFQAPSNLWLDNLEESFRWTIQRDNSEELMLKAVPDKSDMLNSCGYF